MTFEHLRDAAITNALVSTHLHALVNTIMGGNLPASVANLLTASRLIALAKPGGGARPIAIGECLTRLAAKAALSAMGDAAREFFLPLQYGVAVPGGAETVIHAARAYLDAHPTSLVLQADIANAFNSVSRHAIATALQDPALSPLLPFVKLTYGNPSQLLLDINFNSEPLRSERGVRRGDPLGPLLFAAGIHATLRDTAATHPDVLCLAYADDVTLLGNTADTVAAFNHFTSNLTQLGLAHNPGRITTAHPLYLEASGISHQDDAAMITSARYLEPVGDGSAYDATDRLCFTQAALFLASLECAPHGALTRAGDHMLLPADVTTPLHEWLTECEATLPLDAREILKKERLKRTDMRLQHALALQVHGSRYAVQVQETRRMELNPLSGHMQRMFSLTGYGTGDWLTAIPITANRRIGPIHFSNAVRFRLALPFSTPKNCDCSDHTAIPDPRLPNHLLRCGTGKHRINTHNELRDACISMAQDAGFIVHSETSTYCPIEEQTADFTMTDRSSGAVYVCDVTITDPISTRDPEAQKGRGWVAREQANKKVKHYAARPETLNFFPLAVDTYGCPYAEVPVFLKLLADTAARRHFNADSKSFYAAKFLHQFRQRWSVALQRAQSVGLLLKLGEAAAVENPPVGGIGDELHLGDCFAVIEPFVEL
ncbi:unnamed protein product [Closterium sp. NIES-54]